MVKIKNWIGLLGALLGSACHVGYDFRGPSYQSASTTIDATTPPTVLVAVTTGEVTNGRSADLFEQLGAVMNALTEQDGLVGFMTRKQTFGSRIWTMSAWVDEASLDAFLDSDAHRKAARKGGIPRDSVRSARAWLPRELLPLSWDQAIGLLNTSAHDDGSRTSSLSRPR